MLAAEQIEEYLNNLRGLLRSNPKRWKLVVERQVISQVLPKAKGTRTALEPRLWELLVLCLEGHEAEAPALDDQAWEKARDAAAEGTSLEKQGLAVFPRAAVEVALVMAELREVGAYPAPR